MEIITAMERQRLPSASFTKTIDNYSKTVKRGCINWFEGFSVGNSRWKMGISREGILKHHLYLYLSVADDEEELPKGWYREVYFRLILRELIPPYMTPRILEKRIEFTHEKHEYGWLCATLSELQEGYLVNDTFEFQISMIVVRAFPKVKEGDKCIGPHKFKQYVSRLARYLESVEWGSTKVGVEAARYLEVVECGSTKVGVEGPGPKEVKTARQSLKECLLCPYKPNTPDKLSEALRTLNLAKGNISIQQIHRTEQIMYSLKWYMEDYWKVQKANSECEMWRLNKAGKFSILKKCYIENIRIEGGLDGLIREGKQLKKRIQASKKEDAEDLISEFERVEDGKLKILLELEIAVVRTEKFWSYCNLAAEKAAQAEEEKGAAEERLAISTTSWSSNMKSLLKEFA